MKKSFFSVCLSVSLALFAQSGETSGLTFGAWYTGDVVGNFSGGIKRGSACLGMANISLGIDFEALNIWKGGELNAVFCNTHGDEPTAALIGDFQVASNIEAGNHSMLYELWYAQKIGKLAFKFGLQDFNADYAVSENGGLYINSFFGIHSVCADNIAPPIFPLTAIGFDFKVQFTDFLLWQSAVYDGVPDDFENNPYNLNWKLNKNDGMLLVSEIQLLKSILKNRNGSYKTGVYCSSSQPENSDTQRNYGGYFVADQDIADRISVFVQAGLSSRKLNNHYFCIAGGINFKNFSAKRPDDIAGLAVNHAVFRENAAGNETVMELVYNFQLNKNIYIKPDIQYIINPAGTEIKLKNALVGLVRFGMGF